MPVVISGTNGVTFPDSSLQTAAASPYVLKNRIINGAMVVDQRNAGAAVTVNSSSEFFGLDRWRAVGQSTDGVFTVQRDTTVPASFVNSAKITVTTADSSIGSTQNYLLMQRIEGFNTADLNWGNANAQTVTLSFWVRSSVTGTFGGAIRNDDGDYNYPFSYSISLANTYEFKTITITPPTTGTWKTTNATGIQVTFSLGSGSSLIGTANAWTTSNFFGVTGQTNLIATNGATFYITGVQLEQNTSATPFERRLYNQELANCQRYYYRIGSSGSPFVGYAYVPTTSLAYCVTTFPIPMRTAPTALEQSGTAANYFVNYSATSANCSSVPTFNSGTIWSAMTILTTAAVLTVGHGVLPQANSSGYLGWSAEL